ncbi:unnamed protein product [Calypogeia fissa]
MATARGLRRGRKEEHHPMATSSFDGGEGVRASTIRDGKKRESISGSKFVGREGGPSSRVRSQQAKVAEDTSAAPAAAAQVSVSETNRFSSVSLPRRLLNQSMAPILSLKRVRITKASTGQFFVFLLRVAALEAVRRVSIRIRCPQIWWGLQGISLLQAPPFNWFLRWAPLRHFVEGRQSFSKPLIILSLATAVSSAIDEYQQGSDSNVLDRVLAPPQDPQVERTSTQVSETTSTHTMNDLMQALERADVEVPERLAGQELENFFVASNGSVKKFVSRVRKSATWRQTYYFLTSEELKQWAHLVAWHDRDAKQRPTLVIRLGAAYATLSPDERPRFCQAVVSQVEYGILNLLNDVDPRITVIMDCKGTSAIGFPVHMMKTCAVLVQDNFPTRLASLFAVNLPPVVKIVANAVIQVVGQTTREKLNLLGDVYLTVLSEHFGGTDKVPASLGGACHCPECMEARRSGEVIHRVSHDNSIFSYGRRRQELELVEDESADGQPGYVEDVVSDYQSYNNMLRIAIIGFLMLWVLIALVAGVHETELHPT